MVARAASQRLSFLAAFWIGAMTPFHDSGLPEDTRVTFRGPANWFSLDAPSHLHLEQTEAFLEIKPVVADGQAKANSGSGSSTDNSIPKPPWSLTLYAAWVDNSDPQKSSSSFEASSLFPSVVTSKPALPLELPGKCNTWMGMSRDVSEVSWWKQLFKPARKYEWRLWVVEFREIMIVASLQAEVGEPLDPNTVEICEELLNSILFAENFAKPPMLVREEVAQIAKEHFPLLESGPTGSFSLLVDGSEINLSNFYRSYIHSPERIKQIVLPGITAIVRLQELGPEQLMPELELVAEQIMPMLYPEDEADESMADFVRIPWVGGLSVMFVLDEEESYRFVHGRMLEHWGISVERLEEMALENLESYSDENPLEVSLVGEDDDARMLVPVNPSPYNSVRLLGAKLHGRLRQVLGAELVVGVPNRDFFVAVSLDHPELIGQIQQRVVQDYQSMHHPLTSRLLVISADGVSEYCES